MGARHSVIRLERSPYIWNRLSAPDTAIKSELARKDSLLKKATSMGSDLMREAAQMGAKVPRCTFDLTRIEEILDCSLRSSQLRRQPVSRAADRSM